MLKRLLNELVLLLFLFLSCIVSFTLLIIVEARQSWAMNSYATDLEILYER